MEASRRYERIQADAGGHWVSWWQESQSEIQLADWEDLLSALALSDPRLSNPGQDAKEVLSGFLKITQRAMATRRSWVNIAVCACLHSSLTHHRNITLSRIKCERYIFIKCVCSFIEVRKSMLWLWVYNIKKRTSLRKINWYIIILQAWISSKIDSLNFI